VTILISFLFTKVELSVTIGCDQTNIPFLVPFIIFLVSYLSNHSTVFTVQTSSPLFMARKLFGHDMPEPTTFPQRSFEEDGFVIARILCQLSLTRCL
jgi:hypothetical protein